LAQAVCSQCSCINSMGSAQNCCSKRALPVSHSRYAPYQSDSFGPGAALAHPPAPGFTNLPSHNFFSPQAPNAPPAGVGGFWGTCCGPPNGSLGQDLESQPEFRRSLLPYCVDLGDEFRSEKLTLCILSYERDWLKQYGETMVSSSPISSVILKSVFACAMIYAQILSTFGWGSKSMFYGIYLTYWTLTVQNAYHLANLGMAVQAFCNRPQPLPYSLQATTALRAIAEPCALIVSMLYAMGTHFQDRSLANVMVHGVNGAVVLLDALLGRQTSRLANNLWGFAYFMIYMIWTVLHYLLRIGNQYGERCIYHGFCWDNPGVACLNFLLIFIVIMPMTSLLVWSLVWVRDCLISDTDRQRYLAANPLHDPWGGCRMCFQCCCCVLPCLCVGYAVWFERGCQLLPRSDWKDGSCFVCEHEGGPLESRAEAIFQQIGEMASRGLNGLTKMETG